MYAIALPYEIKEASNNYSSINLAPYFTQLMQAIKSRSLHRFIIVHIVIPVIVHYNKEIILLSFQ